MRPQPGGKQSERPLTGKKLTGAADSLRLTSGTSGKWKEAPKGGTGITWGSPSPAGGEPANSKRFICVTI